MPQINLLTLLRCNMYTQKEMGKILGMTPHRVSRMVLRLEGRGIIKVHRTLVQSGRITINGMNQHKTTLYRRSEWDLRKSLHIAEAYASPALAGSGRSVYATAVRTGYQMSSAKLEKSPSTAKQTVSVWAKISGLIWNR